MKVIVLMTDDDMYTNQVSLDEQVIPCSKLRTNQSAQSSMSAFLI